MNKHVSGLTIFFAHSFSILKTLFKLFIKVESMKIISGRSCALMLSFGKNGCSLL